MSGFDDDLKRSSDEFLRVVWPAIKSKLGGGEIVSVESAEENGMATMLDQRCGIDAWHLSEDRQVRGIASRVQWGTAWNTFTVRHSRDSGAKTEYAKRQHDINAGAGWLYPYLTVHAFISGDKMQDGVLLSAAIIKTSSLIAACEQIVSGKVDPKCGGIRPAGNATFIWASWDWLQREKFEIKIVKPLADKTA